MNGSIEQHSIDYIPERERHGKSWHQAPFWFAGNFILPTLLTGYVGPALRAIPRVDAAGDRDRAGCRDIVCCPARQPGPASRPAPDDPVPGTIRHQRCDHPVPYRHIYLHRLCVFNIIAAAGALDVIWSPGNTLWIVLSFAVALGLALAGHDLLHVVQRWVTYCLVVLFAVITIYVLGHLHPVAGAAAGHFTAAAFMAEVLAAASFQLSYVVFVSDYTRYLPSRVSALS